MSYFGQKHSSKIETEANGANETYDESIMMNHKQLNMNKTPIAMENNTNGDEGLNDISGGVEQDFGTNQNKQLTFVMNSEPNLNLNDGNRLVKITGKQDQRKKVDNSSSCLNNSSYMNFQKKTMRSEINIPYKLIKSETQKNIMKKMITSTYQFKSTQMISEESGYQPNSVNKNESPNNKISQKNNVSNIFDNYHLAQHE